MAEAAVAAERPRVADVAGARALVEGVLDLLSALSHVVGEETALVRQAKLTAALASETRKNELAGAYMKSLEAVKINAVALARFAPEGVQRLKQAHAQFLDLIETNQAVLATARSVSETIMRDLAREANPPRQAAGYGPASFAAQKPAAAGPLVLSRQL